MVKNALIHVPGELSGITKSARNARQDVLLAISPLMLVLLVMEILRFGVMTVLILVLMELCRLEESVRNVKGVILAR